MANRPEPCEGNSSNTPLVFNVALPVVALDGRHWLQERRELQKVEDVARFEAHLLVQCVMRHDCRPIAETEALKLSHFATTVTSLVCPNSLFAVVVKPVKDFSAAFEEGHGVFFLTAWMVDIVEDLVLSNSRPEIALRYASAIAMLRIFSFKVPSVSIFLWILMRKKWELEYLASHTSKIKLISRHRRRKDRFWSVLKARTSKT